VTVFTRTGSVHLSATYAQLSVLTISLHVGARSD
jgi:hypothetical protein